MNFLLRLCTFFRLVRIPHILRVEVLTGDGWFDTDGELVLRTG